MDPVAFERLTEQVIGRWIDHNARCRGISQWSKAMMERVAAGNAPGGQSTRKGILICKFDQNMKVTQLLI